MRGDAGPAQPGRLRSRPSQIINRRSQKDAEAPCLMRPVIELICWFGIAAPWPGKHRSGQGTVHPRGRLQRRGQEQSCQPRPPCGGGQRPPLGYAGSPVATDWAFARPV